MNNTYKVKELLDKYDKYNLNLLIQTYTKNFEIYFKKNVIPHLLGLKYINQEINSERAWMLVNKIIDNNLSDQEILDRVEKYHGENQKLSVERRINTLDEFLKNLEKSILVEKTLDNKLPINYLLIQDEHTKEIKHLGICSTDNGALLVSYDSLSKDTKDFFRTYFVRNDKDYYDRTKTFEKVESIKIYDENIEEYIPFSFDKEKNRFLIDKFKENKELDYKTTIEEFENSKNKKSKWMKKEDQDLER